MKYFWIGILLIVACTPGQAIVDKLAEADVEEALDCETADPFDYLGVIEVENGIDDNCNGLIDEGTNAYDDDGDGYTENEGDCNDSNVGISPNSFEIPDDGIDQNCDGVDVFCANAVEYSWEIVFPSIDSCDWGEAGNLDPVEGVFSARTEQYVTYRPPAGRGLCGVSSALQSHQGGIRVDSFRYDDEVLMTYQDRILFSSSDNFFPNLDYDNLGYIYDWDNIVGTAMVDGSFWKWGSDAVVTIPASNPTSGGVLEIKMGNGKMEPINELSVSQGQVQFGLIVFGDRDDWASEDGADCVHSELRFELFVSLAE